MKKLTAIFLVIMLISVFSSCSADPSSQVNNRSDNADKISDDTTAPSEFQPIAGLNYDGYEFRILDYDGSIQSLWYASSVNEVAPAEQNGDPINDEIYARNILVEDLYNVKINIVPLPNDNPNTFSSFYNKTVLADDDLFDAAFFSGSAIPDTLSKNNIAVDLFSVSSLELSKSWWDQNSVKSMSINGTLTAVIGDLNLFSAFAPEMIYANKKLMTDYSIDNIYQYVKDGKWTWDVMYEFMKKVSRDLDGDGIINQTDQLGLECQQSRIYSSINSAGEFFTPKNSEDIPVLTTNFERIATIISKAVPIIRDSSTTLNSENIKGTFTNVYFEFILPKFCANEILFHMNQLLFSFELRNMDADFAILPFPKSDEAQNGYHSTLSYWWTRFTVIPITCTDTERTGTILSAMGYYSQKNVMPAYYDVSITNKLVRDEDSLEMINIILNNRIYDLAGIYNWGGIRSMIINLSNSNKPETFMSEFAKIENKITAEIEKTLDELMG
ncbi:MAG: hypothetical protein FWF15_00660 [Oscillospiraceae bacterium]|nr:hypothetical protein [Oscillospiraceae bacterium]